MRRAIFSFLLFVLAVPSFGQCPAPSPTSDTLWLLVGECVVHDRLYHNPSPCTLLRHPADSSDGYAILKDRNGESQFLLIPTTKTSGIEDPQILKSDAINYFAEAWKARGFVGGMRGRDVARNQLSLAINSCQARSQWQLHIHVDCVKDEVRRKLEASQLSDQWQPIQLLNSKYRARRVPGEELQSNPFQLIASDTPPDQMGRHSIVVVGAVSPEGFFILDTAEAGAHSEELQDHDACLLPSPSNN
jgi:CDP-diacylglycerol pyrophosphatase